ALFRSLLGARGSQNPPLPIPTSPTIAHASTSVSKPWYAVTISSTTWLPSSLHRWSFSSLTHTTSTDASSRTWCRGSPVPSVSWDSTNTPLWSPLSRPDPQRLPSAAGGGLRSGRTQPSSYD